MSRFRDTTAKLETARNAIEVAEQRLSAALAAGAASHRADKIFISDELRAALSRVRAARSKLEHLEGAVAERRIGLAQTALSEAEHDLDRAVRAAGVTANGETRWVGETIERAVAKVHVARRVLQELTETLAREDDEPEP